MYLRRYRLTRKIISLKPPNKSSFHIYIEVQLKVGSNVITMRLYGSTAKIFGCTSIVRGMGGNKGN